ncbi:MAG TPA: PEGA domain-containing protein [Patescibacteria group bacterium]|nr:PEGA domain-containing protein [Patescibacteria group bacterium]
MKKVLLFILILLFLGGIASLYFLPWNPFHRVKHAGLYVGTDDQADIYLNGEKVGVGKYESVDLASGTYTVKLIGSVQNDKEGTSSVSPSWEEQVELTSGSVVAINRQLTSGGEDTSGYLIRVKHVLDKIVSGSEMTVVSSPSGAEVLLDGQHQGETPLSLRAVSVGDHLLFLQKEGYYGQPINMKLEEKKLYEINVELGKKPVIEKPRQQEPTLKVVILQTPNGFLRVRSGAGTTFPEVTRVKPTETFGYLEERGGWYKVQLPDGKEGWVSGEYSKKE